MQSDSESSADSEDEEIEEEECKSRISEVADEILMDDSTRSDNGGILQQVLEELERERQKRVDLETQLSRVLILSDGNQSRRSTGTGPASKRKHKKKKSKDKEKDSSPKKSRQEWIALETERNEYRQMLDSFLSQHYPTPAAESSPSSTLSLHVERMMEWMLHMPHVQSKLMPHRSRQDVIWEWQISSPSPSLDSLQWFSTTRSFPTNLKKRLFGAPVNKTITIHSLFPTSKPYFTKQMLLTTASTNASSSSSQQNQQPLRFIRMEHSQTPSSHAAMHHTWKHNGCEWRWISDWAILQHPPQSNAPSPDSDGWWYVSQDHLLLSTNTTGDVDSKSNARAITAALSSFTNFNPLLHQQHTGNENIAKPNRFIRRRSWVRTRALVSYPNISDRTQYTLNLLAQNALLENACRAHERNTNLLQSQINTATTRYDQEKSQLQDSLQQALAQIQAMQRQLQNMQQQAPATSTDDNDNESESNLPPTAPPTIVTATATKTSVRSVAQGLANSFVSTAQNAFRAHSNTSTSAPSATINSTNPTTNQKSTATTTTKVAPLVNLQDDDDENDDNEVGESSVPTPSSQESSRQIESNPKLTNNSPTRPEVPAIPYQQLKAAETISTAATAASSTALDWTKAAMGRGSALVLDRINKSPMRPTNKSMLSSVSIPTNTTASNASSNNSSTSPAREAAKALSSTSTPFWKKTAGNVFDTLQKTNGIFQTSTMRLSNQASSLLGQASNSASGQAQPQQVQKDVLRQVAEEEEILLVSSPSLSSEKKDDNKDDDSATESTTDPEATTTTIASPPRKPILTLD